MSLPTLSLPARLAGSIGAGHPWVYRDHVPQDVDLADGSWVRVEAGSTEAVGLWSERGAIAVRLFTRAFRRARRRDVLERPDGAWVTAAVERALDLREGLERSGTDAYRLLNGEGDGLPGLTVDRYGRFAVVQTYAEGYRLEGSEAAELLRETVSALTRVLPLEGVLIAGRAGRPTRALWGERPQPELSVSENGLRFLANVFEGQKTGLFLDHRGNRASLRDHSRGRIVANLFAYTGAFSVYALAGGARRAVDVDVAAAALRDAARNVASNSDAIGGGAGERHGILELDVLSDPQAAFSHPALRGSDLIVLDPPSLARRKGQRHAALRAYRRLNAAALSALPDGGLLASASCTAQVSAEAFRSVVAEAAAEAGVWAQVIHESGHGVDHPVPLAFPEGRYLKFVLLRVSRSGRDAP